MEHKKPVKPRKYFVERNRRKYNRKAKHKKGVDTARES